MRTLCDARKEEYTSVNSYGVKDAIAREVALEISRRGGRFLELINTKKQMRKVVDEGVWREVNDKKVALSKIKQTLREKYPDGNDTGTSSKQEESMNQSSRSDPVTSTTAKSGQGRKRSKRSSKEQRSEAKLKSSLTKRRSSEDTGRPASLAPSFPPDYTGDDSCLGDDMAHMTLCQRLRLTR